jgi:hypothetical protein
MVKKARIETDRGESVKIPLKLAWRDRVASSCIGLTVLGFLLLAASAYAQQPTPIPGQTGAQPVPEYIGNPAFPYPIYTTPVPQSSFMAPNGLSSIHLDAYQSDTFPLTQMAPLGFWPKVTSNYLNCISTLTLTNEGQLIGICVPPFNGAPTTTPFSVSSGSRHLGYHHHVGSSGVAKHRLGFRWRRLFLPRPGRQRHISDRYQSGLAS